MTKSERVRLARSVRASLSHYMTMQEAWYRVDNPDADERAAMWLGIAQRELSTLITGSVDEPVTLADHTESAVEKILGA